MNQDILYTPEEVAGKLKISKYTVYEMIKRGDLRAHQIGRHLRISESQLELYLLTVKGSENTFEVEIVEQDGETVAKAEEVMIQVNTDLRGPARIAIRPEDIILSMGTFQSSARNILKGTVTSITEDSGCAKIVVDVGAPLVASITRKSLNEMGITVGTSLYAVFKTMAVKVFR
jgi:molybdopterin-binding protein